MALGAQLKAARMKRGETLGDVAAATQMLAHLVEDIENEDFTRISAPIYAKGFIKLYASHVGLDPEPLLREYVTTFARGASPSLRLGKGGAEPPAPEPAEVSAMARSKSRRIQPASPPAAAEEADATAASWLDGAKRFVSGAAGSVAKAAEAFRRPAAESVASWKEAGPLAPNRPAGWAFRNLPIVLGAVLVIIVLVSVISRLVGRGDDADEGRRRPRPELRLTEEPPAPYVD